MRQKSGFFMSAYPFETLWLSTGSALETLVVPEKCEVVRQQTKHSLTNAHIVDLT